MMGIKMTTLGFSWMRSGAALLCGAVLVLGACDNKRKNQIKFDDQYFRATSSSNNSDRAAFEITVKPVSASLDGAREAGRHQSAVYCIKQYGSSEVDWEIGPDDDPSTYVISNDTLVLRGRCVE